MNVELNFTQCKQLIEHDPDYRATIGNLNDQPDWIEDIQPLDFADIQAVIQGGCASGAYMPAVTYYTARQTMNEHGDEILDFIESHYGDLPPVPTGISWSGMAVFYYSLAVELWCGQFDLDGINWD